MKEHLAYFAKLSSIAVFNWFKVNIIGLLSTVPTFVIGMIVLLTQVDTGHAGHVGIFPVVVGVFLSRPVGSILLLLIFLGNIGYLVFGKKYALAKVINKLVKDKSESLILPVFDKILMKIKDSQPNLIRKGADYSMLQLKIIDEAKRETENKWLRKIICFGMEKIKLGDVDFSEETLSFDQIIKNKLFGFLNEVSSPSMRQVWILVAFQWISLFIIVFFKH